jgi:hypothetical protein
LQEIEKGMENTLYLSDLFLQGIEQINKINEQLNGVKGDSKGIH